MKAFRTWVVIVGVALSILLLLEHANAGEGKDLSESEAADFALSQLYGEIGAGSSGDFQGLGGAGGGGGGGLGGAGSGGKLSCNGCGAVCRLKCGTRRFRYCCFHYVRKRKDQSQSQSQLQSQILSNHNLNQLTTTGENIQIPIPKIFKLLAYNAAAESEMESEAESDEHPGSKYNGRGGSEYIQ